MTLQAYIVVFSTADPKAGEELLPTQENTLEAFNEHMGIPGAGVVEVSMWPVEIESVGYDPERCRSCGASCCEGRLFCDSCADNIATGEDKS